MNKIVRQFETSRGDVFTQWDNGIVTIHREDETNNKPETIANRPYVKETDFESYPEFREFMRIIANFYNRSLQEALRDKLIHKAPEPVYTKKDKAGDFKVIHVR